ncbi:hypothetical protein AX15_005926 [Amanita polypyramis BW_CC]|nr:hypothetical protein AX15_005926 [Amanita polypyramis BW_CC]
MLPDGTPLFEKTRSKKRRPFTEEEDRALKAGYEKHGTVWAAIVKDPIFQEQNRRSTDLRDRFRNAFPDLYQAAGYKPRNSARKKQMQQQEPQQFSSSSPPKATVRAATDDQLSMSSTGTVQSRRRSHTAQGLFRGGTKSVPQSTACSEDDDSSGGEDESEPTSRHPPTPVFVDNVSTGGRTYKDKKKRYSMLSSFETAVMDDDDEVEMVTIDQLADPLFLPPPSQSWSSPSTDTLANSSHTWSTSGTSPASSAHMSPDLMMFSSLSSPSCQRNCDDSISAEAPSRSSSSGTSNVPAASNNNMIGNSAWGTQDWFSPNPRLDTSGNADSVGNTSSVLDNNSGLFPSSPLSFIHNHYHLSQGVMDRYDLFPASIPAAGIGNFGNNLGSGVGGGAGLGAGSIGSGLGGGNWFHDFSSEIGADTHSTFSDEMFPPTGFRGFTHHSNTAGDLIFGARTHQPPLQNWCSPLGLGFDSTSTTATGANVGSSRENDANLSSPSLRSSAAPGLGLSNMSSPRTGGIHPMQLHTSTLVGIDEIELAGITLDDRPDTPAPPTAPQSDNSHVSAGVPARLDNDNFEVEMGSVSQLPQQGNDRRHSQQNNTSQPTQQGDQHKKDELQDRFSLDDLVDLSAHDEESDQRRGSGLQQRWRARQKDESTHQLNRASGIDADVDFDPELEDHATPPATPLIPSSSLAARRASHHFLSLGGSGRVGSSGQHGRSISVPPSEARIPAYVSTPGSTAHQYHDYILSSPRSIRSATHLVNYSQSHAQFQLNIQSRTGSSKSGTDFTPNDATIAPHLLLSSPNSGLPDRMSVAHGMMNNVGGVNNNDVPYDLAFLDLHCYGLAGGNHTTGSNGLGGTVSAAGMLFDEPLADLSLANSPVPSSSSSQALDLAQSQGMGMRYHHCTPDAQQHVVSHRGSSERIAGRSGMSATTNTRHHHRGQSVASVCPQDLVLRRDRVDNKRKRASWDGFEGVYG